MALNWVRFLEENKISDYEIYSLDLECHQFLLNKGVNSILWNYKTKGFTDLCMQRWNIISNLLQNNENVIHSDLDAIWLGNPIEDFIDLDYDAYVSTVHDVGAYPSEIRKKWNMTICCGWVSFKPSFKKVIDDFIINHNNYGGNDQQKFNFYIDSLKKKLNFKIDNHEFYFILHDFNVKMLGLNRDLIFRGDRKENIKVCHPQTKPKADCETQLKRRGLWLL